VENSPVVKARSGVFEKVGYRLGGLFGIQFENDGALVGLHMHTHSHVSCRGFRLGIITISAPPTNFCYHARRFLPP